jgi:hypothetical protein
LKPIPITKLNLLGLDLSGTISVAYRELSSSFLDNEVRLSEFRGMREATLYWKSYKYSYKRLIQSRAPRSHNSRVTTKHSVAVITSAFFFTRADLPRSITLSIICSVIFGFLTRKSFILCSSSLIF